MSRVKLLVFTALLGIFLLSACGPSSSAGQSPVNVEVKLTEFAIQSSVTEFRTGTKYHFIVTNEGQVAHEFMILPMKTDSMGMGMSMEDYDKQALMMIPIEQLPVGATVEIDYTFTSAPKENVELVCMTPGHFEAGMHAPITVK